MPKQKIRKNKTRKIEKNNKNKKVFLVLIVLVVLLLVASSFLYYSFLGKKNLQINQYKKYLYEANLCKYNCSLIEKEIRNKTELVFDSSCLEQCNDNFFDKIEGFPDFTTEEVSKDNLFDDVNLVIYNCKIENYDNSTKRIDSIVYVACVSSGLEFLKQNYTY